MTEQIIQECKALIEESNLFEFQRQANELLFETEFEVQPDWAIIFQKLYLHACLKGEGRIAAWLKEAMYPLLNPIQQIHLRQVFSQGNHLLRKIKS